MENQEWGMDIVAGPLVTLSEAQRRIALEHDCIKSWRVSAQRKAAELKESSTRIATLEAALATQAEEHKAAIEAKDHSWFVEMERAGKKHDADMAALRRELGEQHPGCKELLQVRNGLREANIKLARIAGIAYGDSR